MTLQPAEGRPILDRQDRASIAEFLRQLAGPVAIDLWTCAASGPGATADNVSGYDEQVAEVTRTIASLHQGLRLTRYDIERHAERAAQAGVERAPTVVLRGARGATAAITGICSGSLFPALMEGLLYFGAGRAPFRPESREVLGALRSGHTLDVHLAPYDHVSGLLMRLTLGLATEFPRLQVRIIEVAEFPQLAAALAITEAPLTLIDGQPFTGGWDEADLVEQIRRIDAGDEPAVTRSRIFVTPFVTFEQLEQEAAGVTSIPDAGLATP